MRYGTTAHVARWSLKPLGPRAAAMIVMLAAALMGAAALPSTTHAAPAGAAHAPTHQANTPCTGRRCTFDLSVNPGLAPGKPFFCPAIQNARATITITNRFVAGAQNDVMTLQAEGLPKNTGFDVFLVEHTPLDAGFTGFGFGWYQSDVQSDDEGEASVRMQGILDKETFIENPADLFNPIHTYNVGFWFNSPTEQAAVCGSATPAKTPFNGEQNAGLLAMITRGGPLQLVQPA